MPETLETARFVRDPEHGHKPVLLALGGLDGSPRVGARNWSGWASGSTCARSCWTCRPVAARDLVRLKARRRRRRRTVKCTSWRMMALAAGPGPRAPERARRAVQQRAAVRTRPVSRITGLPRLPTRVYETLAPVVTLIMGRPGWTAALGEGLAAALPRETLTHREQALLRTGATSVNDALKASRRRRAVPTSACWWPRRTTRCRRCAARRCNYSRREGPHRARRTMYCWTRRTCWTFLLITISAGVPRPRPMAPPPPLPSAVDAAARRLVSPRFFSTAADGSVEDGLFNVPSEGPVLFVGNHQLLVWMVVPPARNF